MSPKCWYKCFIPTGGITIWLFGMGGIASPLLRAEEMEESRDLEGLEPQP